MALILSLETSTKVCSVCLSKDNTIIAKKELFEANSHATHLTIFIQELFNELEDISIQDIDAVAVSSGPGSYTGLRIGVSVAKGICYALSKPLIAITSLESLAQSVINHPELEGKVDENTLFCPMIDARRMEVYTVLFDASMKMKDKISAEIIEEDSYQDELKESTIVFLGDGAEKCKETIKSSNAIFLDGQAPLARNMVNIAHAKFEQQDFVDVAYFEPFYLKDFVATTPKKKIF